MAAVDVRDIVIIIPGILGSELSKNGHPIWQPARTFVELQIKRRRLLEQLKLDGDDHTLDDLGDGVEATGLITDIEAVPGLMRLGRFGYNRLWQSLRDSLQLTPGSVTAPHPTANLFTFPYDWRRDNRVAARHLERFINAQLPAWRRASGAADAQVILVTHSMGGLVARYYLECMGGWQTCRGLFTLGTPHRGSWQALDYLMNGNKLGTVDLRPAMTTFTSVYQLLPTYRALDSQGASGLINEAVELPDDLRTRALAAQTQFYEPITAAARSRHGDLNRLRAPLFAIIGIHQPTLQGGWMRGKAFVPQPVLPDQLRQVGVPADGDNTVPAFAAIPQEYSRLHDGPVCIVAESHSALQSNEALIDYVIVNIQALQAAGGWDRLNPACDDLPDLPAMRLYLEPAYPPEGGELQVEILDSEDPGKLIAQVAPADPSVDPFELDFERRGDRWHAEIGRRPPGLYRIAVQPASRRRSVAQAIHDVFEVGTSDL